MAGTFQPVAYRFWNKVDFGPADRCWEWQAGRCGPGYGTFGLNRNGKMHITAHRMSWILVNGPIPDGLHVCHRCDNKLCVNPFHLFLGTARDNMRDKLEKGRDHNQTKTHCKHGHEFSPENTRRGTRGQRQCKLCHNRMSKLAKRKTRADYRARGLKPPY